MDKENNGLPEGIGKAILEQCRRKMNYLFKDTLDELDNVKSKVISFTDDKDGAFKIVRKKLLDRGNDIMNILEIFLKEVEIEGKRSIVKISPSVMEELKKDEKK